MSEETCGNIVTSDEYMDIIVHGRYDDSLCSQRVDDEYFIKYIPSEDVSRISLSKYGYEAVPKVYGLCDTTSMEAVGAIKLRNSMALGFTGKNVLVGIIDTGIDYRHEAFRDLSGRTRIFSIWDQTIQGNPPEDYLYGSEYTESMINEALSSDTPFSVVPSVDTNGHGTFLAGIACGSVKEDETFTGVAPESQLVVVKLKESKKYLRNFYFISENTLAFGENDIMLAASYIRKVALKKGLPYVILLGLGTSLGGHNGSTALEKQLDHICDEAGAVVVVPTGNEGNERGHYSGVFQRGRRNVVEINVGNERGLYTEIWAPYPDRYSLNIVSPAGNRVFAYPYLSGITREYTFELEGTSVYVDYIKVEALSGESVIVLSFDNPASGLWQIEIEGESIINGYYNMWLPMKEFLSDNTFYVGSSPYITLTTPSAASKVISVGGYNHNIGIFDIDSGRGYTSDSMVKPDVVAPSVNVYGPTILLNNSYGYSSGTSIGAAHTAGCAALLFEWAVSRRGKLPMCTEIKSYMIRGARRSISRDYPNQEYGYGELDVYNIFLDM